MAVLQVENAARYGTVRVDGESRVTGFSEKTGEEACGLVNAGVYVFDRTVLDCISAGPSSLEREVFPRLLNLGVYALEQRGMFIDIGTPEDYARAQQLRDRLYETAFRKQESPVTEAG
jgi:NDP-sugar pyrophosphorylase family protein